MEEAQSCAGPPTGFTFGGTECWDLETTAVYTGSITVCFSYDESEIVGPELALVLLHYDTGLNAWVDITSSLDAVGNIICGEITTLSPFRVATSDTPTGVIDHPATPSRLALHQNVPNPFNPATTISFDVPAGGADVTLVVYDVRGHLISTLLREYRDAGLWSVQWDGSDDFGQHVASGTYFYQLQAGGITETGRMVLLK